MDIIKTIKEAICRFCHEEVIIEPPPEPPAPPIEPPPEPTLERPSARDIIPRSDIKISRNRLSINFDSKPTIAEIADTNSMDPVFDIGHNAILISEFDRDKLEVGDVIVYRLYSGLIIHRIIDISKDDISKTFQLKGDNNSLPDEWWIRPDHIKYLMIGVIY
jgi:hypothetical protein